jgi:hypothetical protein
MAKNGSKKGGAGVVEGLWAGTAFFAATKARSFTGFITSFVIYAVILMVVIAGATWLLKTLGLSMPKETFEGMTCPDGSAPRMENGAKVCGPSPAGNTTILPS